MLDYAEPVTKLIDEFKRLPSIGQKSAQRLAFHILRSTEADVERLIAALHEVKERITECSVCNNLTDARPLADVRDRAALRFARGGKDAQLQGPLSRFARLAVADSRHSAQ